MLGFKNQRDNPTEGVLSCLKNVMCTIVGDVGVGKTSLLLSYQIGEKPTGEYISTVLDRYSKNVIHEDLEVNLSLCDIGGDTDYKEIRLPAYLGTDIFLLCFAIDNRASFKQILTKWRIFQ